MNIEIGKILHYKLTKEDADKINGRRLYIIMTSPSVGQTYIGARVLPGQVFPMIVTAVHSISIVERVNGQVFLDSSDVLWVQNVGFGNGNGECTWPTQA